jgi:hypothetical protein
VGVWAAMSARQDAHCRFRWWHQLIAVSPTAALYVLKVGYVFETSVVAPRGERKAASKIRADGEVKVGKERAAEFQRVR